MRTHMLPPAQPRPGVSPHADKLRRRHVRHGVLLDRAGVSRRLRCAVTHRVPCEPGREAAIGGGPVRVLPGSSPEILSFANQGLWA